MQSSSGYHQQFIDLTAKEPEDASEFFLKSFIFELGDGWKEVGQLLKEFRKYLADAAEDPRTLNVVQAANFLQKHGLERTAIQRSEEVKDIDLDDDNRIAFIEYLLLHYKEMILQSYYKRTKQPIPAEWKLEKTHGIGLTGVGDQLLEELFTLPEGLPAELIKAIEEFAQAQRARENRLRELRTKASGGGVKGMAAKNEIKQMECEDTTEMNRTELTLQAAQRKASKTSGSAALEAKKAAEEAAAKAARDSSRASLRAKAALWEQKG